MLLSHFDLHLAGNGLSLTSFKPTVLPNSELIDVVDDILGDMMFSLLCHKGLLRQPLVEG